MQRPQIISICLFVGFTAFAPLQAAAQANDELTAEELIALFNAQKTRGLVIAPASEATAATNSTGEIIVPTVEYVEIAKEEQVNIRVSFDFDSAALREDQISKLVVLCEVMATIDVQVFRIVGHTDSSGSASYNERLSLLRAEEVKRYMVNKCGLPESKFRAVGVGEQFPYNESDPSADENRRVEFQALS